MENLRQQLTALTKGGTVKININSSVGANRLLKQDLQRAAIEILLMQAEDYIFTEEGERRLRRYKEEVEMDEESGRSQLCNQVWRKEVEDRFRSGLRDEVEKRLLAEKLEKEAKKKAAEARRQALIDEIRRQREEEERRIQEALLAEQREKERLIYLEQLAKQKFEENRLLMRHEDELSKAFEIEYKDYIEAQRRAEIERIERLKWEEQIRLREIEEEKQRGERLAELQRKKALLQSMKETQERNKAEAAAEVAKARLEAEELNKKMRIQNKAKYVTKKIKEVITTSSESGGQDEAPTANAIVNSITEVFAPPVVEVAEPQQAPAPAPAITRAPSMRAMTHAAPVFHKTTPDVDPVVLAKYKEELQSIQSDVQLNAMKRDMMSEKRKFRLQQRQEKLSDDENKAVKRKVLEITAKEELIQARIDEIICSRAVAMTASAPNASAALAGPKPSDTAPNSAVSGTQAAPALATPGPSTIAPAVPVAMDVAISAPVAKSSVPNMAKVNEDKVFKECDIILRDIHELITVLNTIKDGKSDEAVNLLNKASVLELDSVSVCRKLVTPGESLQAKSSTQILVEDISGYKEQLQSACSKLRKLVFAIRMAAETYDEPVVAIIGESDVGVSSTASSDNMVSSASLGVLAPSASSESVGITPVLDTQAVINEIAEPVGVIEPFTIVLDADTQSTVEFDLASFTHIRGWNECMSTEMATAAHHAAFHGFLEVLEVLSQVFDCFALDAKQRTPLFYACLRNHVQIVALLVSIDPSWVNVGDFKGDTPIHAAAISNSAEVLKFLLSCCELSPDTTNNEGLTPSHLARSKEVLEILYYVNAQQYCVDMYSRTPLFIACEDGREECVSFLCSVTPTEYILWPASPANATSTAVTNPHVIDGNTCLHAAAANGHANCVEIVCQWLVNDPDALYSVNKKGHTIAHVAKDAVVLQKLYENGVDLWVADGKGRYAIFIAAFYGRSDALSFLLTIGCPNAAGGRPDSAARKKVDIITSNKYFEQIVARDLQGDSALHAAVLSGSALCVEMLLAYIPAKAKNKQGISPLAIATNSNNAFLTQLITDLDYWRVNSIDCFGGTNFENYIAIILYHKSRWTKCFDSYSDAFYYHDNVTGVAQWTVPFAYDMDPAAEKRIDLAVRNLKKFYNKYNPSKILDIGQILNVYTDNLSELFFSLARKYWVADITPYWNPEQ